MTLLLVRFSSDLTKGQFAGHPRYESSEDTVDWFALLKRSEASGLGQDSFWNREHSVG